MLHSNRVYHHENLAQPTKNNQDKSKSISNARSCLYEIGSNKQCMETKRWKKYLVKEVFSFFFCICKIWLLELEKSSIFREAKQKVQTQSLICGLNFIASEVPKEPNCDKVNEFDDAKHTNSSEKCGHSTD